MTTNNHTIRLAVFGATGAVGREMLTILHERLFPARDVFALASRTSTGREVSYGDTTLICQNPETFDFSKIDLCLMSAGADVSKIWAPKITQAGALLIDNSSAWRMDERVPLIVPEVNADELETLPQKRIVANPNCSTIQLAVALKPLHAAWGVRRCVVASYQATSGAGQEAMDELWTQTRAVYVNDPLEPRIFPKQIAFNVLPQIDVFMEDGSTREEWKMMAEIKKILDPQIKLTATCVRVPVFAGHALAVNVTFEKDPDAEEAREILRESPGLIVMDKHEDGGYATPLDSVGEFAVYVSRIRNDTTEDKALNLWVVADNLRKGAALNTVQIAESMMARNLL